MKILKGIEARKNAQTIFFESKLGIMMRYLLVMNRNKTLVQCNLKFDKRFRKLGEK